MKFHLAAATTLFAFAVSQATVPEDLKGGFRSGSIELQLSFGGDASEGLADGAVVSKEDASRTPTFALGDASGVNRALGFTIMMVDTTDRNSRRVHYLQTDFKATGEKTKIESSSQPVVPYAAPGSKGETGKREYSFLMYLQRPGAQMSNVPAAGDTIDVKEFEKQNGLPDARTGMAISVDMGGDGARPPADPARTSSTTAAVSTTASLPTSSSSSIVSISSTSATAITSTAAPPESENPFNRVDPGLFPFPFSFPVATPTADPIAIPTTIITSSTGVSPASNNATATVPSLQGANESTGTSSGRNPPTVATSATDEATTDPPAAEETGERRPEMPIFTQTSFVVVAPSGPDRANANGAPPEETPGSLQDSGAKMLGAGALRAGLMLGVAVLALL
ncbi:predicted protein [Uncinocarpus reesii 1704]|uniref:Uncharacterized protein n=1 Tax=Uncinocarpus reesii (strain UAMH 1704) TaxID=336963 RepID=C4JR93_UNCRE|nr:uncharacterized protein UREG_03575 [Uncinocarpus reesii 1704]EEP78729.1 predicted protein [Uncinocarpus reesii 1704]